MAAGATAGATLAGDQAALGGVRAAVKSLAPRCDLVIGDCGFFWAARLGEGLPGDAPVLISGLDMLTVALGITQRDVGVLTFSTRDLLPMLEDHPERRRLRVVGMSMLPTWRHLSAEDYACPPLKWTDMGLQEELTAVVERELDGGALAQVGALVLECTVMPQFRAALRTVTTLPIFDVASIALATLGLDPDVAAEATTP